MLARLLVKAVGLLGRSIQGLSSGCYPFTLPVILTGLKSGTQERPSL